jgi:hypothetical protein
MGREETRTSVAAGSELDARKADPMDVVICTMADARFYLGLVALINSLRLTGHGDVPVVVLDGGLTDDQRLSLEPLATVAPLPHDARYGTPLAKADVASLGLSGVILVVDADCIVTGSLRDIFRRAASGRICAVRDDRPGKHERRFDDWEWMFGLSRAVREDVTYVNAGMICVSDDRWPNLLPRWAEVTRLLPAGRYVQGRPDLNPIWAGDQDALNAILMSEIPSTALDVLPPGTMAYAQWRDTRVVDLETLRVTARGTASTVAHFSLGPKPWARDGWKRVGVEALLPLYTRCLLGEGLAIRPDPASVPWWLKADSGTGTIRLAAGVRNRAAAVAGSIAWGAYDRLPAQAQTRLRKVRGRDVPRMSSSGGEAASANAPHTGGGIARDVADDGTDVEDERNRASNLPRVG